MRKGEIYIVDFGKSKDSFSFGKVRPVIVFQTNKLNFAIEQEIYDYVLVIPLSTQDDIATSDFRVKIAKKENLKQDSYAVTNSICFLHKKSFKEKIATLNDKEILEIENTLKKLFDFS